MIKHEYDAFNEFEADFDSAMAVLSVIQDSIIALHSDHNLSNAVWGAERLLASARSSLESGRVYGSEND